nr:hypothetical protein [Acidobacteriota bacterium]
MATGLKKSGSGLGAEEVGLKKSGSGLGAEVIGLKKLGFIPYLLQPAFFSPELASLQPAFF